MIHKLDIIQLTQLSVDVVYLPIGYYTMVFEMYFSNTIDVDEKTINARYQLAK